MKKSKFGVVSFALPLVSLGFALTVSACGGDSDSNNKGGSGGSSTAGSSASAGKSSSSGGSSNKAGNTGTEDKGGTDAGPGPGSDLDVPGDAVLGELTDDQAKAICEEIGERFDTDALSDISCKFSALIPALSAMSDEEGQAACQASFDACKAEPGTTEQDCTDKPSSSCTATVDEFAACLKDFGEMFDKLGAALPDCATVTRATATAALLGAQGLVKNPESCVTFQEKCPESGFELPDTSMMP